jgi:hypothetical protein
MKITRLITAGFVVATLTTFGFSQRVKADETQALELVKPANDYVGIETKDKVVQIRSEKSIAGLRPNIWYVVFYDHDTMFKTTEIKFGAGQKLDVRHPIRPPFSYINDKNLLDMKSIKVDSDKAINIAKSQPLLEKLTVRAAQLWLQNDDNKVPTWRVRLWAQKLRHPDADADIGDVYISAEDGTVQKIDLHIDRVD